MLAEEMSRGFYTLGNIIDEKSHLSGLELKDIFNCFVKNKSI